MQRIALIPASIISGLVFAAAGGFYVWREIFTPPLMHIQNVVASRTPIAPSPVSAPVATQELPSTKEAPVPRHLPLSNSKQEKPIPWKRPSVRSKPDRDREAAPTNPSLSNRNSNGPQSSEISSVPPIRIEHSHKSDAVDPMVLSAWNAYRNGDLDTASQHYGEVLRKDTQNRDALLGMAAIAQQQSQDGLAAKFYSQLLSIDPRDPDAHAGMSSLLGENEGVGAESHLKLLLAQQPESAALHFALGNHYAEQARWGDAEQAYFDACELESDNAQFAFNLAVSLDHLGQKELAAQHYRHALELDGVANASFAHAQAELRLNELTQHP
jgi:Flp pilus assembly protein TadD